MFVVKRVAHRKNAVRHEVQRSKDLNLLLSRWFSSESKEYDYFLYDMKNLKCPIATNVRGIVCIVFSVAGNEQFSVS